ncbi:hypothetical protein HMI49_04075 [Corallococcus exercitus]|uniref:Uncharacterized protein n=1 Tax=Corallococcus exercitus TaxID=2316736 RepID=A0A7Y4NQZ4_9BACT|nr:hypothetical protein [Corallococcus exercitus]NOK32377.1 hypothetical protein [Corallococcus exercitus]
MKVILKLVVLLSLLTSSLAYAAAAPPPAHFGSPAHVAELAKVFGEYAPKVVGSFKLYTSTALRAVMGQFGWKVDKDVPANTLECIAYKIQLGFVLKMQSVPGAAGLIAWTDFQARRACGEDDDGDGDPTKGKAVLKEAAKVLPAGIPLGPKADPNANRDLRPEHSKPVPPKEAINHGRGPLPEKVKQTVASINPSDAWTPAQTAAVGFAIFWALAAEAADVMTLGLP